VGWRFFERFIGVPPDIAAITAFSFARFDALPIALPKIADRNRKNAMTKRTDGSLFFSGIGAWTVGVLHLTSGVAPEIEAVVALRRTWL